MDRRRSSPTLVLVVTAMTACLAVVTGCDDSNRQQTPALSGAVATAPSGAEAKPLPNVPSGGHYPAPAPAYDPPEAHHPAPAPAKIPTQTAPMRPNPKIEAPRTGTQPQWPNSLPSDGDTLPAKSKPAITALGNGNKIKNKDLLPGPKRHHNGPESRIPPKNANSAPSNKGLLPEPARPPKKPRVFGNDKPRGGLLPDPRWGHRCEPLSQQKQANHVRKVC